MVLKELAWYATTCVMTAPTVAEDDGNRMAFWAGNKSYPHTDRNITESWHNWTSEGSTAGIVIKGLLTGVTLGCWLAFLCGCYLPCIIGSSRHSLQVRRSRVPAVTATPE